MSDIVSTYEKNTPGSAEAQRRATQSVVGGNSRGAAYWRPYPLQIERADGARLVDVDGREYYDLVNNFTSLVHGHAYRRSSKRSPARPARARPGSPTTTGRAISPRR